MPMSEFVAGLRRLVGHELLLLPTVAVRCKDEHGRILLVRQIDSGRWSTPGGAMEPDETPEDAAMREAREETGVDVTVGAIVSVIGGPRCHTVYPNGDELAYVAVLYDATVRSGAPKPDGEETSEVAWFTPEEITTLDLDRFAALLFERSLLV